MQPDEVRVRATREGPVVAAFTAPEWITLEPYRTDRITFGYSSEHDRICRGPCGDAPVYAS